MFLCNVTLFFTNKKWILFPLFLNLGRLWLLCLIDDTQVVVYDFQGWVIKLMQLPLCSLRALSHHVRSLTILKPLSCDMLSYMERPHEAPLVGRQSYSLTHSTPDSSHVIETILDPPDHPIYQKSTTEFPQWLEKQRHTHLSPAHVSHLQYCGINKMKKLSYTTSF